MVGVSFPLNRLAGFPRGEYASSTIPGEKYGKKEEKKQRRKEEGGNKGALM